MTSISTTLEVIDNGGFANVTQDAFLPVWSSALSLSNCIFFLIVFIIYLIGLGIFLFRISRKVKLVRNHKVLFALTIIFVLIQVVNLLCRLVHDSLQIHARLLSESGQLVGWSLFVAIQVTGGITTFAMYINFISLFEIIFFVQRLFWKTARMLRAISEKTHKIIEIIILIANITVVIVGVLVVLAVSSLYAIKKFEVISNNYLTYAFIAAFVAIFLIFVFLSSLIIISGILVIRTIKITSRNVTQAIRNTKIPDPNTQTTNSLQTTQPPNTARTSFEIKSFEKRVQSPFKITFGLLIGLILCILLELISIALASTVTSSEDYKAIWHFFNCLGVIIYAVLLILLFYPLFLDSENALKEIEKRNQLVGNTSSRIQESPTVVDVKIETGV